MKKIIKLLDKLEVNRKGHEMYSIRYFSDLSGYILLGDEEIYDFHNKKQLKKLLEKELGKIYGQLVLDFGKNDLSS